MIKGIDISEWQSSIPSFDGKFIMLRAGYGTSIDARFKEHYQNAIAKGLKVGVYWYSYALTEDQAREEARKCLEVISGLDISMGIWFDMEDADSYKKKKGWIPTIQSVSTLCNAFCEITEKAGYYSGIYSSLSWMQTVIKCPKYDKWVAYWGSNDGNIPPDGESAVKKYGSIWQYTSKLGGKSLDGDILLHDDIDMYNIKPNKPIKDNKTILKEYKSKFDALWKELENEIK